MPRLLPQSLGVGCRRVRGSELWGQRARWALYPVLTHAASSASVFRWAFTVPGQHGGGPADTDTLDIDSPAMGGGLCAGGRPTLPPPPAPQASGLSQGEANAPPPQGLLTALPSPSLPKPVAHRPLRISLPSDPRSAPSLTRSPPGPPFTLESWQFLSLSEVLAGVLL